MTRISTARRATLLAAAASFAFAAAATAQNTPAPADPAPQADGVADIVVTATRTSQVLSKVPISVTAIDQRKLDVQGIRNFTDIVRFTPGITFTPNGFGTQASVAIRGIDSNIGTGTVGVYVDDTPIQTRSIGVSSTNTYPQLFDLDRVEVLRGPQGTLFGAGSEGGTVRFITPQPSLTTTTGYARAELGFINGGQPTWEIGAAIGTPIVADKIGIRASFSYRRDGGYIDRMNVDRSAVTNPDGSITESISPGTVAEKNANRQQSMVGRVAITLAPIEDFKITPSVLYQDVRLHDVNTYWDAISDPGNNVYRNGQILRQPDHDRFVLPALRIEYEGPGFDVISNTSFFVRHDTAIDDYTNLNVGDFTDFPPGGPVLNYNFLPQDPTYAATTYMDNRYRSFTQEVRLQSNDPDARFTWVIGGFYSNLRQRSLQRIADPHFDQVFKAPPFGAPDFLSVEDLTGVPLINGTDTLNADNFSRDRQLAGFGQASFRIVGGLKATAGVRVSDSRTDGDNFSTGPFIFGTSTGHGKIHDTPVTPKFSLDWQADRNNLVYATASKGFRQGGVNQNVSPTCDGDLAARGYDGAPLTYTSDSLWSYELGTKNKLFGGNTLIEASAFHIKWKSIQQLVYLPSCSNQFNDNLGSVVSDGFDVQITQRIAHALTLNAAVSFTNAHFDHDVVRGTGEDAVYLAHKGDRLQSQPWTVVLGGQYDFVIDERKGYLRADYNYRGGHKLTPGTNVLNATYNPTILEPTATNNVNLRLGAIMGPLDLSVFATNVTNDHPRLTNYTEGGDPVFRQITLTPRTIGVTAAVRY